MATADGRLRITFNGEIYNYRELRNELEAKGCAFHSNSDTEVLLHLYADRGAGDGARAARHVRVRHLGRARAGAVPRARSARHQAALLRRRRRHVSLRLAGRGADRGRARRHRRRRGRHRGLLPLRLRAGAVHVPPRGARAARRQRRCASAAAGCAGRRGISASPRNSGRPRRRRASCSAARSSEQIRATLRDSMRHHMVADVPVGIFLSVRRRLQRAGRAGRRARPRQAARHHARLPRSIAARPTTRRSSRRSTPSSSASATRRAGSSAATFATSGGTSSPRMDQASTDGVNSYLVVQGRGRRASSRSRFRGLGGDELFGGYPSFRDVPRMRRWIPSMPGTGQGAARAVRSRSARRSPRPSTRACSNTVRRYAGAYLLRRALYMPWELPRLLGRERAAAALEALRPLERLQETIGGLANERCIVSALELSLVHAQPAAARFRLGRHGPRRRDPRAVRRRDGDARAGADAGRPESADQGAAGEGDRASAGRGTSRRAGRPAFRCRCGTGCAKTFPRVPRERGLRGWARVVGRHEARTPLPVVRHRRVRRAWRHRALQPRSAAGAVQLSRMRAAWWRFPRTMPNPPEPMPDKLAYRRRGRRRQAALPRHRAPRAARRSQL